MNRMLWLVVGILVLLALSGTFYVVREYEQVIITQFGKPVGKPVNTAGLKTKLPFIQKVHRFEKRFLEWDGDPNQLPTKDKRFIWVDTYARWHITDPLLFFQRLRDERGAKTRLDDILDGETRNAIAKYDVMEVVRSINREAQPTESEADDEVLLEAIQSGRGDIRREVLQHAQARTTDLGIEILDVQFKRINYVEDVQQKVYERMVAERKRIADRFRSEGEGEASRINGERERELQRIQSGAYKQAQEIKGRADALATRIYADAYDRNPEAREFYAFLKTMESYEVAIDPGSRLILSTDADFYKYLKQSR
ncbi:MAG TPA: protease modulator HflC [Candidatus Krumholzibacteria bacterium]|nr:protease modulator HflC [Candidatus Krumholzibacteria bacterium]HPD70735.1 protease modulator HflC [Candidatus Krumholzibacteria bacterium]HRY39565.1 protease modulator HflC [Candidatus Krumholzibacteria bacterium]